MAHLHISISDDLSAGLKRVKTMYGVPVAETVRRAISEYLEKYETKEEVKRETKSAVKDK